MPRTNDTSEQLQQAAADEFNQRGYHGTDSNKIARRAGFAPQTFYRWFKDKTEVFIAVYHAWESQERLNLETLVAQGATASAMVDSIVQQHQEYRVFRRSLRQLAVEDERVRKARAESRKHQCDALLQWQDLPRNARSEVMIRLLQIERLADAIAEGEFRELGVPAKTVKARIASLLTGAD